MIRWLGRLSGSSFESSLITIQTRVGRLCYAPSAQPVRGGINMYSFPSNFDCLVFLFNSFQIIIHLSIEKYCWLLTFLFFFSKKSPCIGKGCHPLILLANDGKDCREVEQYHNTMLTFMELSLDSTKPYKRSWKSVQLQCRPNLGRKGLLWRKNDI